MVAALGAGPSLHLRTGRSAQRATAEVMRHAAMRRPVALLWAAAALLLLGLAREPIRGFSPPAPRGQLARTAQAPAEAASVDAVHEELPARPREVADVEDRWIVGVGLRRTAFLGFAIGVAASAAAASAKADRREDVGDGGDIDNGAGVFAQNCAACHAGGNNAVQPDKKLKKEALVQYGMYDVDRIMYQVTNGKNAMPAFGERLGRTEIADVAAYVFSQAENGWP